MVKNVEMIDELPVEEPDEIEAILNAPDEDEEAETLEDETAVKEDTSLDDESDSIAIEDMPDDADLWIGGPKILDVKNWKQQFENVYVTSITYDKHVVWRTMNRAEYKAHIRNMEKLMESGQLSQAAAGLYNEEAIAELCILYPQYDRKNSAGEMAGVPSIISQEVMEASGFTAIEVRQL